jgi:hypothetical protein
MTTSVPVTEHGASRASPAEQSMTPSDWLASVSFGEGLRRGVILLRNQFRWYVVIFFVGGVGASLLLLPINQTLTDLADRMLVELLSPLPDLFALGNLVLLDLGLTFLANFATAFLLFLLSCIAIRHAFRAVPSLGILRPKTPSALSASSVATAALLVAAILAAASVVFVAVPFLHALLLFAPVIVVAGSGSGLSALRLSTQMRHQHWQRLLCTLVAGLVFTTFAGTLGDTLYLNLQTILNLLHVPTGFLNSILQIVITQLPVATVAPLLPLLSLVFYPSAMTAREDHIRSRFLRRQRQSQRQLARYHAIPLGGTPPGFPLIPDTTAGDLSSRNVPAQDACPQCGASPKRDARYCHVCGAPLG